jgi:hypothetical protein
MCIIVAIKRIISRHGIAVWVSIQCYSLRKPFPSVGLRERGSSTSAAIVFLNRSALIFAGCSGGSRITISVLDIRRPAGTHGWTKLILQIIDILCDCSAPVLPFVIRKTEIDTKLSQT